MNEIAEYEQYSYDTSDEKTEIGGRLLYGYLCAKSKTGGSTFSGIERAMTVVARKYMFDTGVKDTERARLMLQAWCGTVNVPEEIKSETVYNWLHDYIYNVLLMQRLRKIREKRRSDDGKVYLSEKEWMSAEAFMLLSDELMQCADAKLPELERKLREIDCSGWTNTYSSYVKPIISCISTLNLLPGERKSFGKSMFEQSTVSKGDKDTESGGNDYKVISYDKILAEASDLGALKKRYLLLDDVRIVDALVKKEKEKDMLLKTVSAFLLGKTYEGQEYAAVNYTDILNWQNNSKDDDYRKWRSSVTYKDEKLFKSELLRNQAKLRVLPEFAGRFELVEAADMAQRWSEFKKAHSHAVYYDDRGSAFALAEKKGYSGNE